MRKSIKLLAGMTLLALSSGASAQSLGTVPTIPLSSSTTKATSPTVSVPVTSPLSAMIVSIADISPNSKKSIHATTVDLNYDFNPILAATFEIVYNGPLDPELRKNSVFTDPEFGLGITVPTFNFDSRNKFDLSLGTAIVAPASQASINNHLLGGWGAKVEMTATFDQLTISQLNIVNVFSYYAQPTSAPISRSYTDTAAAINLDDASDSAAATPEATASAATLAPTYMTSIHRLRIQHPLFTNKLTWKGDIWLLTDTSGTAPVDKAGRVTTTLHYAWAKSFTTFAGVFTQTGLIAPNAPALFTAATTATRLGMILTF
jgi:hypothetical protein